MSKISEAVFLVGSGKGGVGKSTVAVNLAAACAALGLKTGLLDADIYGPSIPAMTGLRRMEPRLLKIEGKEVVVPFHKFGLQVMSIGFFMEESEAALWRGPIIDGALKKMIQAVDWGPLDVLFVDLPPGTGDVPITLSKLIDIDGAILVTTPQKVAELDVIKAMNSFLRLNIPLLGLIENMSGFTDPETGKVHDIFGKSTGEEFAKRMEVPFLGKIPLTPALCRGGDAGIPAACHSGDDNIGRLFHKIVSEVMAKCQLTRP